MAWFTKEIKLSELNPTEDQVELIKIKAQAQALVKQYGEEYGLKEEDAFIVRKGLVPKDLEFVVGERAVVTRITTDRKDRDNEVIEPLGAMLDDFRKHPVVLWAHRYDELPVAKADWIKVDGNSLVARHTYANHQKAREIFDYRRDGFPMAQSIGFIALAWTDHNPSEMKDGRRRTYTKWALLEYSDVPVPCNADCLQIAVSKGWLEEDQTIENMQEYLEFDFDADDEKIFEVKEETVIEEEIEEVEKIEEAQKIAEAQKEKEKTIEVAPLETIMEDFTKAAQSHASNSSGGTLVVTEESTMSKILETLVKLNTRIDELTVKPEEKEIEEKEVDPDELDFDFEEEETKEVEKTENENLSSDDIVTMVLRAMEEAMAYTDKKLELFAAKVARAQGKAFAE